MIKANYQYKDKKTALKRQKERYLKRVKSMMQKDIMKCFYLTFTFSDKTLKKNTAKTRLRYIKSYLNQQASEYILNCDYGKLNGREHYHAFILSRYKIIVFDAFKYGYIKAETLHKTLTNLFEDRRNLTAERLTNHAFKETTRNTKIIYSRASNKINRAFKIKANKKLLDYQNSILGITNKKIWLNQIAKIKQATKRFDEETENLERQLPISQDIKA